MRSYLKHLLKTINIKMYLPCNTYIMLRNTTTVLRIYELIQKNKCTFIFTKSTNYAIEDTLQEKRFS